MRCTIAAVILTLLPSIAMADGASVEYRGNLVLSDKDLDFVLKGIDWSRADDDAILKRLHDAYYQRGHLFARMKVERGEGNEIVVWIDEDEVAHYNRLGIRGARAFNERRVRDILNVRVGDPFRPGVFNERVNDLLHAYDDAGYPFVQIWMDSLELDPGTHSVGLTMIIVEGGAKTLGSIQVDGLTKTKEKYVVKLSGLKVGEPYDGRKLHDAYLRLTASGIFDDVSYPKVRLAPDGLNVEAILGVAEPVKNSTFSAALGYAERESDRERILSGQVRLDLVNIGGALRDFNVSWRNDGQSRNETKLAFKQRFFFGSRMSFGVSLEQIGLDTLYTWQSVGVEAGMPIGRVLGGLIGIDVATHADRNTFSEGSVARTLRGRFIGGWSYVRGNERRGTRLELRNRNAYAVKQLDLRESGGDESIDQFIIEGFARGVVTFASRLHFDQELNLKTLESNESTVPLSEQFYIGGAATVRGYRENQFHGRRVAWSRSELLVGRSRIENGYLFVDLGYILQETASPDDVVTREDLVKVGYGFGIRTRSNLGNIDISFAAGEELSLQQTKVHVMLNRSF